MIHVVQLHGIYHTFTPVKSKHLYASSFF